MLDNYVLMPRNLILVDSEKGFIYQILLVNIVEKCYTNLQDFNP